MLKVNFRSYTANSSLVFETLDSNTKRAPIVARSARKSTFPPLSKQEFGKFTGCENGITIKIPFSSFKVTKGKTKVHIADNGSGVELKRILLENGDLGYSRSGLRREIIGIFF